MFSTFVTVALFVAPAIQGALAEFAVNSPDLVQCQEAKVTFEETTGPYDVFVLNPEDPCGAEYLHLGQISETYHTFQVALPAGLQVQMYIEDSTGDQAWSSPLTVGPSDDDSCVPPELKPLVPEEPASSSVAASSSAAPTTTTQAPTTTSPTTSKAPTTSASVAPVGAANAGVNPFGDDSDAAPSIRQISTSVMAFGSLVALLAFAM